MEPFYIHSLKPIFHCDAKPFALGPRVGLDTQRHNFALGIPTCWYLKTLKFALPSMRTLKLLPTPTPNASRWNIGGIGSPTRGAGIGHVDFMLFTSYSLALGTQREPSFQWNTGLRVSAPCLVDAFGNLQRTNFLYITGEIGNLYYAR